MRIYICKIINNLFLLDETFTNGFNINLIVVISLLSILCGIFVIISKNPIVSVLFLIGLFLNVAAYLMMLGLNFIGLSYLLVYVGAVSILFLFILMLINVRISELTSENSNSIPLAIITAILLSFTLYELFPKKNDIYINIIQKIYPSISHNLSSYKDLLFASSQYWDGTLAESSHITSIGNILYTGYPMLLLLTSLILLLAMVGAIIITIKQ